MNNQDMELELDNHIIHTLIATNASLLHYTAEHNDEEGTKHLVDQGYYMNVQDSIGDKPLMIAVRKMHENIIRMLIKAGADMMLLNHENKSAIHYTCEEHDLTNTIREFIFIEFAKKFSSTGIDRVWLSPLSNFPQAC